jgi:hypothetical protein
MPAKSNLLCIMFKELILINQQHNSNNLAHKETDNKDIDLYDIIQFLIYNRSDILKGLFLGAFIGLGFIILKGFNPITTTTIPVIAKGIAENEFYRSINLTKINDSFKKPDPKKNKDNNLDKFNAFYYLNKKLNTISEKKQSNNIKNILIDSLEFQSSPSGYQILVDSSQKNLDIEDMLKAINFAANEYNKKLIISSGNDLNIVEMNNYVDFKNKLTSTVFTTQKELTELILPLEYEYQKVETTKFTELFKNAKINDLFLIVKNMLEQKTDYSKKENFNNLITSLEVNHIITAEQANLSINKFLELDRLLLNQTSRLNNFPIDKILPLFESSGRVTTAPYDRSNKYNSWLVFIIAIFLGGILGVLVSSGKIFYSKYKSQYIDKI